MTDHYIVSPLHTWSGDYGVRLFSAFIELFKVAHIYGITTSILQSRITDVNF
jgi:hypothetical protein